MPIRDTLLPEYDQEMATTRKLLERVPDQQLAWSPHQKSMTLGRLATHLSDLPGLAAGILTGSEFDLEPPGQPPAPPRVLGSRDAILTHYDQNVARGRAAIAAAEDADLAPTWTLKRNGAVLFAFPRAVALRILVLSHVIHHRGQLTVYLRLLDVALPVVYGRSADEG